jgi:hypothetical protein
VNPNSGPLPWPVDEAYAAALTHLSTYRNVTNIGYVHAAWCTRTLTSILADIETYQSWPGQVRIRGLFLDDTPSEYVEGKGEWLARVNTEVRLELGADAVIVHNPGTFVDPRLMATPAANPSVTVVSECAYPTFCEADNQIVERLAAAKADRLRMAVVLHSLPASWDAETTTEFVQELIGLAGSIFVTNLSEAYYRSWGSSWWAFVKAMDG